MELFRVFDWDGSSPGRTEGGPLFVPRGRQGAGRHDAPSQYGAWYCSRDSVSAVAETIQFFRGQLLTDAQFRNRGMTKAIVTLRLDPGMPLVDLDDPKELLARRLRPSGVATRRRSSTQKLAAAIFAEGAAGLLWWSVLDAEWTNVTLFYERALPHVTIATPPRPLSISLTEVEQAADHLGIAI